MLPNKNAHTNTLYSFKNVCLSLCVQFKQLCSTATLSSFCFVFLNLSLFYLWPIRNGPSFDCASHRPAWSSYDGCPLCFIHAHFLKADFFHLVVYLRTLSPLCHSVLNKTPAWVLVWLLFSFNSQFKIHCMRYGLSVARIAHILTNTVRPKIVEINLFRCIKCTCFMLHYMLLKQHII